MNDAKRQILARVAAGELTPAEAAAELEELGAPAPDAETPPAVGTPTVARIRVEAGMGSVTVIGDESVLEAVADGPHVAHREADTLVIQTGDENTAGFVFGGRFGISLDRRRVTVRMNPRLPLDTDVQAGTLRIQGVRAPIRAEVQAGTTQIDGFTEPLDLDVQAGSVRASGKLTAGHSRIRCQAGKVSVNLDPGSSVKISAKTGLGRIALPGNPVYAGVGDRTVTTQVGAGLGSLDISSEMGSVQVEVAR
jgi:hypothetical protein